ncbi:DNA topoisomerase IB [Flagellimonas abyssi]|uniref:DNA topoisomerase n=1 Tax=Flagellimonas abyssi TaxID=2864871 RepID=A0ABS7EU47_9FLAO|nr:DNA topoisomerase IB [Allomuricauda abyssi]MBW8201135.1 DNA topoisomerase IB [Allomuricauda abyssi]
MSQIKVLRQLVEAPETALEELNLVYVDDQKFTIERLRKGKGFTYRWKGKPLKNKKHLKRIKGLVIPPAWNNVKITHLPNGHIQAVGYDEKNRKQYRYHSRWVKIRNQTKFYKMTDFGKQLPIIRKQVNKDLKQKDWPKNKVVALIIKLMEETHIRIGNEQYAKRNESYGLSTLRKKNVDIHNSKMLFEFVGKKGKKHAVTVRNKKLIRLVSLCEDIPGWELFKYYDEDGKKQSLDSSMVNDYLREIAGKEFFSAKDFRTWAATVIFFNALLDIGIASNKKEIQENLLLAYDTAAKALGNTRNVCKTHYVHPHLVYAYENGSIKKSFAYIENHSDGTQYFSPSETAVLKIIKGYRPRILQN